MKRILLTLCALSVALAAGAARAAEVTGHAQPPRRSPSANPPNSPSPSTAPAPPHRTSPTWPGLDIEHVGQSTQVQIINGAMSVSSVHTYQVTPQRAGHVHDPGDPGRRRAFPSADPQRVRRHHRQSAAPARGQPTRGSRGSALPPPNVPMPPASAAAPADARYGFIQLVVPKKEFYVGELVPVEVNAYVPCRDAGDRQRPAHAQQRGLHAQPARHQTRPGRARRQRARLHRAHLALGAHGGQDRRLFAQAWRCP